MNFSPKNSNIVASRKTNDPHALVTYRADKSMHGAEIFEEIAIGQTIGAWDERYVDAEVMRQKVAKIVQLNDCDTHLEATIAFPLQAWNSDLSWLLTLVFGKMSFYPGVTPSRLSFEDGCFFENGLQGPLHTLEMLRVKTGAVANKPLLMGILKPNVAMSADALERLYCEVAEAGVHLVKDDEIRHDSNFDETLRRVEKVANRKAQQNLKTMYVVHAPINAYSASSLKEWSSSLKRAGADALLINVWTVGLSLLQELRRVCDLPLVAHPALAGALGQGRTSDAIDPAVTLASFMRAAGADLTLFPSPYGKIGLPRATALEIANTCRAKWPAHTLPLIPVPSAGIKPEHVEQACKDFGNDFILNAGTAIFASGRSIRESAQDFLQRLETFYHAE